MDFADHQLFAFLEIIANELSHDSIGVSGFDFNRRDIAVVGVDPDGAQLISEFGSPLAPGRGRIGRIAAAATSALALSAASLATTSAAQIGRRSPTAAGSATRSAIATTCTTSSATSTSTTRPTLGGILLTKFGGDFLLLREPAKS